VKSLLDALGSLGIEARGIELTEMITKEQFPIHIFVAVLGRPGRMLSENGRIVIDLATGQFMPENSNQPVVVSIKDYEVYIRRATQVFLNEGKGMVPEVDFVKMRQELIFRLFGESKNAGTIREDAPLSGRSSASEEKFVEQETARAIELADMIKIWADELARKANKEEGRSIIIGIETDGWIPGEQRADMQALGCAVKRFVKELKSRGIIDNVKVAMGNSKTLIEDIRAKQAELGDSSPHIAVLGSEKTLGMEEFRALNGAFLAYVDLQNLENLDYIQLIKMLTVMLNQSFGKETPDSADIVIEIIGDRVIRLKPIKPIDKNEPSRIYKLQIKELAKQA